MKTKRILSLFLSTMLLLSATQAAMGAQSHASTAEAMVYLTVSCRGELARDNDGEPMANRTVYAKDIDEDGSITVEEMLIAAHEAYNTADGFDAPSGFVSKLWGMETSNTLFFKNNVGLTTGVSSDTVSEGDRITASINKDDTYWADWLAFFDEAEKEVEEEGEFTLTLKGHLGMAYTEEDSEDVPLENISVGTWENGEFTELAKTDENGMVSLSLSEAGKHYIVAFGTVSDVVTDYNLINLGGDPAVYGTMDSTTYESFVAYTEEDYGEGPYPASSIKYVEFFSWRENQESYNALQNNKIICDCPIIAPVCVVTAGESPAISMLHNIAEKYTGDLLAEDENIFWFIADIADYNKLYPQTGHVISDELRQLCLDRIIEFADKATEAGDLSKAIIALRALGYDAENTYTKKQNKLDVLAKLSALVDEKAASVTNIYTLPYVIIALNQGEDYATDEQMEYLINAAKMSKSSWQDTQWGTDSMTPMVLALSPYYAEDESIKSLLDETAEIIKSHQTETGATGNAASTGLAIAALCSIGKDPESIAVGTKNMLDALMEQATQAADGFEPSINSFATEQGMRGLNAWQLLSRGERIYDFKSFPMNTAEASPEMLAAVKFVVLPSGAKVEIDGFIPVSENSFELPEGSYVYEISKNGYKTSSGEITITAEDILSNTAKEITVSLQVSGNNSGKGSGGSGVVTAPITNEGGLEEEKNAEEKSSSDNRGNYFEAVFSDVLSDAWYYDAVKYVYENELMQGTGAGFEPETKMTRAMLATVLFRMEKAEGDFADCGFADVKSDAWYYDAVCWAKENGIVSGMSETEFSPDGEASREQLALILYRFADLKGKDKTITGDLTGYKDAAEISSWAFEALAWAEGSLLITGTDENMMSPKLSVTRAQLATILMRFGA